MDLKNSKPGFKETGSQMGEGAQERKQDSASEYSVKKKQAEEDDHKHGEERSMPARSSAKLLTIAAGIVTIIVVSGIALASCSKNERPTMQPLADTEFHYATLEASWNQFAEKFPAQFRFFGERGDSDSNIIAALNHWLAAFSIPPDEDYQKELEKLKDTYGMTTFHAWEEFRREHYRKNPLILKEDMDPVALCEAINNYIGVARAQNPQDYISAETVTTIVYMNSVCAFFDGERDKLRKEGIDTEIYECGKLSPGTGYPTLDALTRR